jgi:hypothetical protein
MSDGRPVIKYLDRLMPVASMDYLPQDGVHPLIIFKNEDRICGLVVQEIIDITSHYGALQTANSPNLLGSTIMQDQATDILNPEWYTNDGISLDRTIETPDRIAAE